MLAVTSIPWCLVEENTIIDSLLKKKDDFVKFILKKCNECIKKIPNIEQVLKKNNIDVNAIKRDAKSAAGKTNIKDGKINKFKSDVSSFIVDLSKDKYSLKKKTITESTEENEKTPKDVATGLLKSVGLFAVVLYVNIYFVSLAIELTGSKQLGKIIGAIFIGPMVEEVSKLISVKNNFTWEYFTVFNIGEFSLYANRIISSGGSIIDVVIYRVPAILMHLYNTISHEKAKEENKSDDSLKFTMTVHSIFNTIATFVDLRRVF